MKYQLLNIFQPQEEFMKYVTLQLEDTVAAFYDRNAAANGLSLEQVLSDALFKLAGELSLEALGRKKRKSQP